ncbi:MAG: cyclomaltodextrinase N-terminal domain-containing protein [Prolixibacteraceae bacterium]
MKKLSVIVLFIIWAGGLFATQVDQVEPLFWWTGMKNPSLQLMVHGEDISAAAVSLNYPGVSLESVSRVENPNYLFINLNIGAGTRPGRFDLHFRTAKKQLITYSCELTCPCPTGLTTTRNIRSRATGVRCIRTLTLPRPIAPQ